MHVVRDMARTWTASACRAARHGCARVLAARALLLLQHEPTSTSIFAKLLMFLRLPRMPWTSTAVGGGLPEGCASWDQRAWAARR